MVAPEFAATSCHKWPCDNFVKLLPESLPIPHANHLGRSTLGADQTTRGGRPCGGPTGPIPSRDWGGGWRPGSYLHLSAPHAFTCTISEDCHDHDRGPAADISSNQIGTNGVS